MNEEYILKKANECFRKQQYKKAESLYLDAYEKYSTIRNSINFNIKTTRRKIVKSITKPISKKFKSEKKLRFGIISPPHTMFLANNIKAALESYGWIVSIYGKPLDNFFDDYYFVLCPNLDQVLPPGEKRILYQLEQSLNDRWFTDKYITDLNNSLAILDYSIANIEYLETKGIGYPLVYYMPIGIHNITNNSGGQKKDFDFLFYGDSLSSPRRRYMLKKLSERFHVHVVNDIFGSEMHDLIRRSRYVINLHYYERALLETPRIIECLALGTPVISETAEDMQHHRDFGNAVIFFKAGAVEEMLKVCDNALKKRILDAELIGSLENHRTEFNFMFARLLIGLNILEADALEHIDLNQNMNSTYYCLSMPETFKRRSEFLKYKLKSCAMYNGFRYSPGWVGCGMSYQSIAANALQKKLPRICIMEDDVILPDDFNFKINCINSYLDTLNGKWDLFSGLIAHLNEETEVLDVNTVDGITYVTINKMTSTVCNIYNKTILEKIASWNQNIINSETNTIDRFIESMNELIVVTTIPFLVGHREEVHSSLWEFKNTQYSDMIKNSETQLIEKANAYLSRS